LLREIQMLAVAAATEREVAMKRSHKDTNSRFDLVAGAERALVVALTDESLRFTSIPNDIEQELRYVEAAGTKTLLIAADPANVRLLSPAEIDPALRAGRDRAVREADRIKAFWA
jgi:NTE family protein